MSFCSGGTTSSNSGGQGTSNQYGYANPLGPTSYVNGKPVFSASGAAPLGSQTLSYLGSNLGAMNQAGQNYASALNTAASNPGWGAAQTNAANTAAGDYLSGSPALNRALAQNQAVASAGAADTAAREKSMLASNGLAFGTGQQQALQAATAVGNENAANTNAQAYLSNYQAERQNQNNAGSQLAQATGTPLSYLGQVGSAYTSGLAPAAQLISGLGSGGQMYSTGTQAVNNGYDSGTTNPSVGSDILNTIGAL